MADDTPSLIQRLIAEEADDVFLADELNQIGRVWRGRMDAAARAGRAPAYIDQLHTFFVDESLAFLLRAHLEGRIDAATMRRSALEYL